VAETAPSAGSPTARRAAVAELGAALRELADAAVGTEVDDGELRAATAAARELAARLRTVQRGPGEFPSVDVPGAGVPAYNPVYGPGSPVAPMLVPGVDDAGRAVGRVTVGRVHEGFPGLVHGGVLATLFDVVLVHAVIQGTGRAGMTGTLTIRYRGPVPLGVPLRLVAEATASEGRRTTARASLVAEADPDTVLAEADAVFVTPRSASG
jgi:acyl-coenzyme A thioesterase PaaI-like protein